METRLLMVYLPRNEATWAITIQLCEDEIAEFLTKKDKEYLPQLSPALLGSIMIWAAGLSQLLPHYSLFYGQLWTPSKSFLGKYSFRDPNIVTVCSCIYLLTMVKIFPFLYPFLPDCSYPPDLENVPPPSSNSMETVTVL